MSIGIAGEGCYKAMKSLLGECLKLIAPLLSDPHPRVRWAACNCLGQLATDFGPDYQTNFGKEVVSMLVKVMQDPIPRVHSHAATCLINFCETCTQEDLYPHLDLIITHLGQLLSSPNKKVQEIVVTSIASVAEAASSAFAKYYDTFVPFLKSILKSNVTKDYRLLRAKAMECVTLIGSAVGKERFTADAGEIMQCLLSTQGLEADDPQIGYLEASFGRIAECLGMEFCKYLPAVLPASIQRASYTEEIQLVDEGDELADGWEVFSVADQQIAVNTSALEDKAAACNIIQVYAENLKEGFAPYVSDVVKLFVPMLEHDFHEGVKVAASGIMPSLIEDVQLAMKKGSVSADPSSLNAMWQYILEGLIKAIKEEESVEILDIHLNSLSACIDYMGENCLTTEQMTTLMSELKESFDDWVERYKERIEHKKDAEDDEEELEKKQEEEDFDDNMCHSLVDLLGRIARNHGGKAFAPFTNVIVPSISPLMAPNAAPALRQKAICLLDDFIEFCSPEANVMIPASVTAMISCFSSNDHGLRQAAVYGVGVCSNSARVNVPEGQEDNFFSPSAAEACARLIDVIKAPNSRANEEVAYPTENAISAVGKIIKNHANKIKVDEVIPFWISQLPLVVDEAEATACHKLLLDLIQSNSMLVMGEGMCRLPHILSIIGRIVDTSSSLAGESTLAAIKALLAQLQSTMPQQQLAALFSGLSPECQKNIAAFMAKQ